MPDSSKVCRISDETSMTSQAKTINLIIVPLLLQRLFEGQVLQEGNENFVYP